jgi:hypothetical protein
MPERHWLYFGGFVLTGLLLLGAVLLGLADAVSVLSGSGASSEEALWLAALGEAVEWIFVTIVLGLVAVAFLGATLLSVLRNTSVTRKDRLVSLVERLEREYPLLRELDASERVEPTTEERKKHLKAQYVSGELEEEEFEREMEQLMNEE